MTSTIKADSMSTSLSEEEEDYLDDVEEMGFIGSQDDPLSTNEIIEQETKSASNVNDRNPGLCRLCAGQAINPVYIYSEFGESMKLAHKMNTCLSVKIRKTDDLPKQLCHVCVEKINWCDAFDEQCIKAEETLETILREEKERSGNTEIAPMDIQCDEVSCPLCVEGHMRTSNELKNLQSELYDSDIVLESSDEEKMLGNLDTERFKSRDNIDALGSFGNTQQYLKCGACMNLYHTKESLDVHKCKPNVQLTSRPWKCFICEATFPFEERLNFHLQFHNGAKELYCEICKIPFVKELKAFYHYKRYHCEDKSVSCLQCGKLFVTQQELKIHVCVDGKTRPHVCEICSKGFSDGYTLKRHVVTHLPEKPYKCSQCSKSFTQKSRLNKHIASHGIVIENAQIAWKCVKCGETFETCNEADAHNRKYHDEKISLIEELTTSKIYHCEFCNSYFNELENLRVHESLHVLEKPYTCNICDTVYKSYAEAVVHWKEHPRSFRVVTAYMCDVCGKDMKEMSLLYKHRRKRQHVTPRKSENDNSVKKYVCELCGKSFEKSEGIRIHGRDQCSKFPCDICGNLLPTANSLHAHKRRHSGLRPYVCNICGKSYTQSSHMWTHKRFHMGVKPYACQYCDQRFTIKPDLADHTRKKHTRERPFKCDVCNKAFLTGSVFYQHRLIHRGDRRYKCHYCEKAFTRTEALNNHIKIHTGEKPHACDVCGRCFRQKGDMRKHRRTQHNVTKDELP
ncbi:zinc finger protein 2 homolog [Venturia canescens]|uniref:zinc finger protein 2 homolog n=1 Tax=Venturia canescens TaxID=32260 RepID=UPI001C9CEFA8|nr:zinc finger protein 2 homolog [Venturia canescens]